MTMYNNGMKYMNFIRMMRVIPALLVMAAYAQNVTAEDGGSYILESVDYVSLPGNKMQVQLGFNKPVTTELSSFSIDNPARVSIDIPEAMVSLEKKTILVDSGVVKSIRAVEANRRTRIVIGLNTMVPYEIRNEQNSIYVNFNSVDATGSVAPLLGEAGSAGLVDELNFRRGEEGEGKVIFSISNPNTVVNIEERGSKLIIDFVNAKMIDKLVRRLDVIDFATPITTIDAFNTSGSARVVIESSGEYEHMAYQSGKEFAVNVSRLNAEKLAEKKKDKFGYSGEKLSLNFQNIEVRAVLQLLADFTGLNVVASDTVQGNITLRLKNVPWDQALDIILRTRGLGMRKTGNVVLIAPNSEISAREKEELDAQKQRVDLAPLETRHHQINYAKASVIAGLLKGEKNSILTERGDVTIDDRTNTLIILESAAKHDEIANLIEKLDVPVKQVMIESRIVIASDDFGRDIGVRLGVTGVETTTVLGSSPDTVTMSGSSTGTDVMVNSAIGNLASTGSAYPIELPSLDERYNVNLPASGTGRIAMAILGSSFLVDLELSALQTEGRGEVLSNPRVITSNQQEASIEQGVEIPYQEASSSGATSISFKKAVLSLKVTPLITPDDKVSMKLSVNKDSIGGIYSGIPSINTRSIDTEVLVNNGDTVVLGGIYEQSLAEGATKVPLLGDIPVLGALFRTKSRKESKAELLIFVTPKILNDSLNVAY